VFQVRNGLCPSYLADILHACVPSWTLQSSDTPTLKVPNVKLITIGDGSVCSACLRLWNSLPHSLRAGALACSAANPGTVTALLRLHLLDSSTSTYFGGLLYDHTLWPLPSASIEHLVVLQRADSPQGSVNAIKNAIRWPVLCSPPFAINVRRKM